MNPGLLGSQQRFREEFATAIERNQIIRGLRVGDFDVLVGINLLREGLDLPEVDLPLTVFPDLNMYFGGVGAALATRAGGFDVASDPRREGGTAVCG